MNMDGPVVEKAAHMTPLRHNRYTHGVWKGKVYAVGGFISRTPRWFTRKPEAILLNAEPAERNADSWYPTPKAVPV